MHSDILVQNFDSSSPRLGAHDLCVRNLDEHLPDRLPAGEILLRLLNAFRGEGILAVDVDLERAVRDELEQLLAVYASLLRCIDIVPESVSNGALSFGRASVYVKISELERTLGGGAGRSFRQALGAGKVARRPRRSPRRRSCPCGESS